MTNSKQYWQEVVGRNIRKYRKQKNMTQAYLSEAAGLSENMIAKMESKTQQGFSIDCLLSIANVLEVPLDWFWDKSVMDNEEEKTDS